MCVTGAGLVMTLSLPTRLEARYSVRAAPRTVCLRSSESLPFAGVICFDVRFVKAPSLLIVLPAVDSLSSDSSLSVEGADDAGRLSMLLLYRTGCAVIVFVACRFRVSLGPWASLGSVLGYSVALRTLPSSSSISFCFF